MEKYLARARSRVLTDTILERCDGLGCTEPARWRVEWRDGRSERSQFCTVCLRVAIAGGQVVNYGRIIDRR